MHRNTILLYVNVKVVVGGYFWFLGREAIMSLLWSCLKQTEPPKEYTRMLVDITANAMLTTQIDPRQSILGSNGIMNALSILICSIYAFFEDGFSDYML